MKLEDMVQELRKGNIMTRRKWAEEESNQNPERDQRRLEMYESIGTENKVVNMVRRSTVQSWRPEPEDVTAEDYEIFNEDNDNNDEDA